MRFNYQSIGSGGGQKQIAEQTVDFGASDGPMSDDSLAKAPGKILHIPTVAGAVVVTFNAPGLAGLKLDGETLANIFLGKITKWNDPAIARLNPQTTLPHTESSLCTARTAAAPRLSYRLPERREPRVDGRGEGDRSEMARRRRRQGQ